jgi:hypothetical protein
MGFAYDEQQVKASTRKDGNFKGVAEYVFFRQTAVERHVIQAVQNAELIFEPYPHFVIENVLPQKDYEALLASLPKEEQYVPIKKVRNLRGYPERFVAEFERPAWIDAFTVEAQRKFGIVGEHRDETLLIKDKPNYQITPHTDVPARIFSAIMYLGDGVDGTVVYEPKKKGFECKKGLHLPLELFKKVKTIPYRGNTAFVFLRTDNSFHGVEKSKQERNVLLYDLRRTC